MKAKGGNFEKWGKELEVGLSKPCFRDAINRVKKLDISPRMHNPHMQSRERERRVSVYDEAPGFRLGPRQQGFQLELAPAYRAASTAV